MKKSYLTLAAVAAIMASCTNEVLIDRSAVNDVEIGFSSEFVDNATKADLTMTWFETAGNAFGVYGFKQEGTEDKKVTLYTNEKVTRVVDTENANNNRWTHPTVRFWDKAAVDAYDFYAYAPYAAGTGEPVIQNPTFSKATGFTFSGMPVISTITSSGSEDKAIAISENKDYNDVCTKDAESANINHENAIAFTFNHVLSKLSFKAKSTQTKANITVTDIKIDFPSATSTSWAQTTVGAVAGKTAYTTYAIKDNTYETTVYPAVNAETLELTTTGQTLGNSFIVVPVNETTTADIANGKIKEHEFGVEVTYNIKYSDGTPETSCKATGVIAYSPAQNDYWIVTIDVNPDAIEFCVEGVNDWADPTEYKTTEGEVD